MSVGYRVIWVGKSDPYARPDGSVFEHRYVMMCHLKRKLQVHEFVHHINHNKLDNKLKNLSLMTASFHSKHHHPQLVNRWAVAWEHCDRCHQIDQPHAGDGLCRRCYNRRYNQLKPRPKYPYGYRQCAVCSKRYGAYHKSQACCSQRCAKLLYWTQHDHKWLTCQRCGHRYRVKTGGKLFCSRTCYFAAHPRNPQSGRFS